MAPREPLLRETFGLPDGARTTEIALPDGVLHVDFALPPGASPPAPLSLPRWRWKPDSRNFIS